MKKIIYVIIFICLIVLGIVVVVKTPQKGSNSTELSSRSKEYLEKQKSRGNLEFGGIDSGKKVQGKTSSQKIQVGKCFSLEVPFVITDNKHMDECFDQITINSPRGIINVYTREVSFSSLEEDPGVKMRRADPQTYKEERRSVNGSNFIIFKKTDAGYEKTALYLSGGRLFSLNLLSSSSDPDMDKKFYQMLESVEFL